MEEALHTLRARVRPPGMPLPQLFHNLFPAPRGFLNRESLWDELVRLFDLEEEVTWLACCAMDPNGMGLDFAAFAAFMQQVRELPCCVLCVGCVCGWELHLSRDTTFPTHFFNSRGEPS